MSYSSDGYARTFYYISLFIFYKAFDASMGLVNNSTTDVNHNVLYLSMNSSYY